MKSFNDVHKTNLPGYPRTLYEDADTLLQVWKRGNISCLTLLISKHLLPDTQTGEIDIEAIKNGRRGRNRLSLPLKMKAQIRQVFDGLPLDTNDIDGFEVTDTHVIISFGENVAFGLESRFEECDVIYNKEEYMQFQKALGSELDAFQKEMEKLEELQTTPAQREAGIRIGQAVSDVASQAESVKADEDYHRAVERLLRLIEDLDEIEEMQMPGLKGIGLGDELTRKLVEVRKSIQSKLDGIGYEFPSD